MAEGGVLRGTGGAVETAGRQALWARSVGGLGLAAASALLLTLAFPPYDLWPLIWVGFVPMLVAQHRVMPRSFGSVAAGVAVGGFFWGYLGDAFADAVWFMRWLPLIIGGVVVLGSLSDSAFQRRTAYRWFVPSGAITWVGVEMIRSFIPIAGTWGFVAYALYEQPWLLQPVSIFGIFGLSLLVMLVNQALALAALALFDRRWRLDPDDRPVDAALARRWLIGAAVALVAWTGLSLALLQTPDGPTIRVAAIQPRRAPVLDPATWKRAAEEAWPRLPDLTRDAARRGARLIVWNEGGLPFDPQIEHTAELRTLAAETGAYLVMGYGVDTPAGFRNEVTVLAPDGTFLGVYGKDHPVTFAGETSVTGGSYPVFKTALGILGAIICYDLDFTDTARKVAANGPGLIATPSGDWPAIAAKHYTHVVFRAVENRVAMVKADAGFDSAIIDPYGRIADRVVTPAGTVATIVADVPLGRADALAIRLGDWIGWLTLAGLVFFVVLDPVTAAREKKAGAGRG